MGPKSIQTKLIMAAAISIMLYATPAWHGAFDIPKAMGDSENVYKCLEILMTLYIVDISTHRNILSSPERDGQTSKNRNNG